MKNKFCSAYKRITTSELRYRSNKLPVSFDNFRILHVSDLHNRLFGERQKLLIQRTKDIAPDIIVVTGDLIDRRRMDIDAAMEFVSQAVNIAPVYFVAGNHEMRLGRYDELSSRLKNAGAHVLDDRAVILKRGEEALALIGVKDLEFSKEADFEKTVGALSSGTEADFKILLAHKPKMHLYSRYDIDLVFCGHAHGGQFRIPKFGGLYSPDQGVFPKYTSGLHTENDTAMVISRGLGNSIFPIRIFNCPELVVVQLIR